MESVDQQWQCLRENYARMTEDELGAVADDAYDLTPVAREALQAEISGRGLNIELKNTPPAPVVPTLDDDLIGVTVVYSLAQAKQVMDRLDADSIPSYLGPDKLTDPNDFKASFDDGVALRVSIGDQRRAIASLARRFPEDDIDYTVLCPKCHSPEIIFQGREMEATDNPEADDDPDEEENPPKDAPFNWKCDACGYQWTDDGVEHKD